MLPKCAIGRHCWLSLAVWTCLCLLVSAQAHSKLAPHTHGLDEITCRPFGTCERCPDDSLHEPFCQPFGNRRLMHCTPASTPPPPPPPRPPSHQHEHPPARPPARLQDQGETPAWESCGRIPAVERADFWEFFACNVFFAAVALVVVFARSKRLEAMHARQLAARIGLVRGSGRG